MRVELSPDEVKKETTPDGRDVYRVPGRDLPLKPEMNPTFGRTGEDKKGKSDEDRKGKTGGDKKEK